MENKFLKYIYFIKNNLKRKYYNNMSLVSVVVNTLAFMLEVMGSIPIRDPLKRGIFCLSDDISRYITRNYGFDSHTRPFINIICKYFLYLLTMNYKIEFFIKIFII